MAEIGTGGLDPVDRRTKQFRDSGLCIVPLFADHPGQDPIARDATPNKEDKSLNTGEPLTAVGRFFYFKLDNISFTNAHTSYTIINGREHLSSNTRSAKQTSKTFESDQRTISHVKARPHPSPDLFPPRE
jgi:hypothetical protein